MYADISVCRMIIAHLLLFVILPLVYANADLINWIMISIVWDVSQVWTLLLHLITNLVVCLPNVCTTFWNAMAEVCAYQLLNTAVLVMNFIREINVKYVHKELSY